MNCPICHQPHSDAALRTSELVFDFLKNTPILNRKQTGLGGKTRCGLTAAFDAILATAPKPGDQTANAERDPKALWNEAFTAFKKACDASHVGDLRGEDFDRAAIIYGHFEAILAHVPA